MQRARRNWLSGAGCCGLPDFSTTVTCLKFMKCSSRLVRPCTSSSVGPLFTGKSPQGALAAWGKGRDRGEVDPTQLGGFNLFLTAAGGTSSRLVPKRHLITLPRVQVIYIRLPTTAAAPRCRVGRGSPAGWSRSHDGIKGTEASRPRRPGLFSPRGALVGSAGFVWSVSRETTCVFVCVPVRLSAQLLRPLQVCCQPILLHPAATIPQWLASMNAGGFFLFHATFGETLPANLPSRARLSFLWEHNSIHQA